MDLLGVALLVLAAAAYFWPVLFEGQSFHFRDTSTIYYTQAQATVQAWREGRLPSWEPRIACGYPFQADPHSMVFYPPAIVLLFLPMPRAYNVFVVLHVVLAGVFTFLLLRRWRLGAVSSLTGALLTMFCGYTVSTTYLTTLLKGTTWTPLALLAFDHFLAGGRWRALVATALVLAIEGSGTDPQYVLFTLGILAAAPWLAPRLPRPALLRAFCGLGVAALLAGALLAYQYLPLFELIRNSDRSSTIALHESLSYEVGPGALLNLILPLAFPELLDRFFLLSYPGLAVPLYLDLFWGLPVLALALASLGWRGVDCAESKEVCATPASHASGRPPAVSALDPAALRRSAVAALLLALLGVVLSVGDRAPFFPALSTLLPMLRFFRYPCKHLLLTAFALPLAASIGFEGISRRESRCLRRFGQVLAWVAAGLGASFLGLQVLAEGAVRAFLDVLPSTNPIVQAAVAEVSRVWNRGLVVSLAVSLAGWMLVTVIRRWQGREAVWLLAALSVGQMIWVTSASLPLAGDEVLASRSAAATLLGPREPNRPNPRCLSLDYGTVTVGVARTSADLLFQNDLMTGLRGWLDGCANVLGSMSVHLSGFMSVFNYAQSQDRATQIRLAGALGASQFLFVPGDDDPPDPQVQRVGKVAAAKPARVSPRAFIAPRAVPTSARPGLAPTAAVLALPEEAVYDPGALASPGELAPRAVRRCEFVEYRNDGLKVEFDLQGDGLLVVLDSFYPGWHALVDGRERPIVKVAQLFRGVPVREGERVLEMEYRPTMFWIGAAVSLGTLAVVALSLVFWGTVAAFPALDGAQGTQVITKLGRLGGRLWASPTAWNGF
ncbi:MAG: YfhO family protein, partial [Candidatus Riflebacteria bacterium]|nr:YfhO family protein [Candidatus Riflebacteria bacterium]